MSDLVDKLAFAASSADVVSQTGSCSPFVAEASCQTKRKLLLSIASQCGLASPCDVDNEKYAELLKETIVHD